MRAIDLSSVTWRKSSYSNTDGGNCVEVSDDLLRTVAWRKSSYSNSDGGACLEVSDDFLCTAAWRKSTHSNSDGGQCLEFADNLPSLVPVRDSKAPARGALLFRAEAWGAFVGAYRSTSA
ncbi:protein of unknown function [Streptomyces sp. yr375]|uniref:DUF397 domain-containing protein n=1 Tax=Streptomyces sp. yr375 TaxID=1761906 RepID=UPI0008D1601A|nr:DUF397 domain-containing protein [Streptomyces sp. yr375]SER80399.1 protein of unknown function [Streptomyces sp. yr375]